MNVQKQVSTYM